jgi:drug/metabolite transporter (DMT)-like permease
MKLGLRADRTTVLGYGASLLSAAGYGTGAVVGRKIVDDYAPPMVATAMALVFGSLPLLLLSQRHIVSDIGSVPRRAWVMMALTGLASAWGVAFMFLAVNEAPVVLVAPIGGVYPLFVIILMYLFLKRSERITWQTILGAVLVVGGVAAITIGRE